MSVTVAARIKQLHQICFHRKIWKELTVTKSFGDLDALITNGYSTRVKLTPELLSNSDLFK